MIGILVFTLKEALKHIEEHVSLARLPIKPSLVIDPLYIKEKHFLFSKDKFVPVKIEYLPNVEYICKCYKKEDTYYCFVNKDRDNINQRLAVAHCAGHILLGHLDDNKERIDFNFKIESNQENKDANLLASHILYPTNYLKNTMKIGMTNISKIADIFQVSTKLVQKRLIEEGYLEDKKCTR